MRQIVCAILIICGSLTVNAAASTKDSLKRLLRKSHNATVKASVYQNLADLCFETPEEKVYLKATCREAQKAGNKNILLDALSDLAASYIKTDQIDSARYFMKVMEKEGTPNETEDKLTFLELKIFDVEIASKNNEKLLEESLKPSGTTYDNPYKRLRQAYITGSALFYSDKPAKAIPYYLNAIELCKEIPLKGRGKFEILLLWQLAHVYAYNEEVPKTIENIEKLIVKQEFNYNKFIKPARPFYNINTRLIQDYAFLLSCITHLPKEKADLYMRKLLFYSKKSTSDSDKYSVHLALYNYYVYHQNFPKAIETNDSLIKLAKVIAHYNLPGLYRVQSVVYSLMGNYKDAYLNLKLSYNIKDSLMTEKTNKQLSELEVKHNVEKLNYEKTLLEVKNKRNILICLTIILLIFVAISIYQHRILKKEKKMKAELRTLHIKAQETENMKTAFINSICHEIRTPLNAIVGFSELALDESIDPEIKETFPDEIHRNTLILTTLINDMLVVSNLDSSNEKLPCEPEDLNNICIHEMDKLKRNPKENIEYILKLSEDHPLISTHSKYLALVLEHLLDNAGKFTESGHIAINYIFPGPGQLRIEVEDTGCGIPVEKHKTVFERFSKLDPFKQGNGLGLYLCKLIVTRLSGQIFVDPTYTSGTRIVILLPV